MGQKHLYLGRRNPRSKLRPLSVHGARSRKGFWASTLADGVQLKDEPKPLGPLGCGQSPINQA
jgi:hypothetical protein